MNITFEKNLLKLTITANQVVVLIFSVLIVLFIQISATQAQNFTQRTIKIIRHHYPDDILSFLSSIQSSNYQVGMNKLDQPTSFTARIRTNNHGLVFLHIKIDRIRKFQNLNYPYQLLLRGKATIRGHNIKERYSPLSIELQSNKSRVIIFLLIEDKPYRLILGAENYLSAVRKSSKIKMCGQLDAVSGNNLPIIQPTSPQISQLFPSNLRLSGSVLGIEISVEADNEFYSLFGSSTESIILSTLNTIESIYEPQLQLGFILKTTQVLTSPSRYNTTEAACDEDQNPGCPGLLNEFTNYNESFPANLGSRDLAHLMSAKTLNDNTLGVAWLGTVCALPSFAYGLSTYTTATEFPVIAAHEIGHNLGADHDDFFDNSAIMNAFIDSPPSTKFSTSSKFQINSHVEQFGSCLSVVGESSDGNQEGEGDLDAGVALSASLSRAGRLLISMDGVINTPQATPCTLKLRMSPTRGRLSAVAAIKTINIETFGTGGSFSGSANIRRRSLTDGGKSSIFSRAELTCQGQESYKFSNIKRLNTARILSNKPPITPQMWMSFARTRL